MILPPSARMAIEMLGMLTPAGLTGVSKGFGAIERSSRHGCGHALWVPIIAFTSKNSSKPNMPCSRPLPDCL